METSTLLDNPHFSHPFTIRPNGRVEVVEQDSPEEVATCTAIALRYPIGSREADPTFGRPLDLSFAKGNIDVEALARAIAHSEPRAPIAVAEEFDEFEVALRRVNVLVGGEA